MKRISVLLTLLGGVAAGLLLASCAGPPEITPAVPPPTPAVVAGAGAGPEVPPVEAAAARFPLPPPELEALTVNSDNCIACHTDQEQLQELAVEPEEEESLSEGEG